MKKILGLDLGVSSIGWALIDEEVNKILGLGTRIIHLSHDDTDEFSSGNKVTKNQKRTQKRTQRKGYDRYQLRRKYLIEELKKNNMLPDQSLLGLDKLSLWKLRNDAVDSKIELNQLGRILLHLNQKRGYNSPRSESNLNKEETEHVANIKSRYEKLKELGLTIGQYFYNELSKNEFFRIKDQVFPREAYVNEFNLIMANQKKYYPRILTDKFISKLRDEIIYFQRKLKSQKSLVSVCDYEGFWTQIKRNDKNYELFVGPRVAPKSSPLFQVNKIWENINNISLKKKTGEDYSISLEKKFEIFNFLDNNEKLTATQLFKILDLNKNDFYSNKLVEKGLHGNLTKVEIRSCFENPDDFSDLFRLNLIKNEYEDECYNFSKSTGEIISTKNKKVISPIVESEPLYKLWHIIYSINEKAQCKNALQKKFGLPEEIAEKLASLDFTKQGFSNKSHRAIRKMLPYLMEGDNEYSARCFAGYMHTISPTSSENFSRKLESKLKLLPKNSLRQPVVEKILNQMINLVNALIEKFGIPDEVRIELARELKQSKDERYETAKKINQIERENKIIEKELTEFGLRATRNNIIKWRLYNEISSEEKKQNAICVYCGKPIPLTAAILGEEVEVEHIIPKSLLFDDSQSNKTLAHRTCNANKKDMTAYDFMKTKSNQDFTEYCERVQNLYKNNFITKAKLDKLLMSANKIPDDFIARQLRETQYISRKAREILSCICYNVWTTTGAVTSELRHVWGWDNVLENLQLPKYRESGLTELVEIEDASGIKKVEKIKGWSKRDDHRHHAIDALTIACTKQGIIQRINKLNSSSNRNEMLLTIKEKQNNYDKNKNLLENYILSLKPFTTHQVQKEVEKILVSYKAGKKVAVYGKRKIKRDGKKITVQDRILIPRGALSEESIYGKINIIEKNKPLKYLFNFPHLIFKSYIKNLVVERLAAFDNNATLAIKSIKKDPIFLDSEKKVKLEYASCFKEEYVIRKSLKNLKENQIDDIVDPVIKEKVLQRISSYNGNFKEAFKDLDNDPIYLDDDKKIPIKNVRCFTGLSAVEPLKFNENGIPISFVKPANNHHLAIYIDEFGNRQIHYCTFWHAVERKKFGFPVIIKNPASILDYVENDIAEKFPDSFLEKLPNLKWTFVESFQQNEMYILNMSKDRFLKEFENNNFSEISKYLYRLQNISSTGYKLLFRHHLATTISNIIEQIGISSFNDFKFIKIRTNILGEIIL